MSQLTTGKSAQQQATVQNSQTNPRNPQLPPRYPLFFHQIHPVIQATRAGEPSAGVQIPQATHRTDQQQIFSRSPHGVQMSGSPHDMSKQLAQQGTTPPQVGPQGAQHMVHQPPVPQQAPAPPQQYFHPRPGMQFATQYVQHPGTVGRGMHPNNLQQRGPSPGSFMPMHVFQQRSTFLPQQTPHFVHQPQQPYSIVSSPPPGTTATFFPSQPGQQIPAPPTNRQMMPTHQGMLPIAPQGQHPPQRSDSGRKQKTIIRISDPISHRDVTEEVLQHPPGGMNTTVTPPTSGRSSNAATPPSSVTASSSSSPHAGSESGGVSDPSDLPVPPGAFEGGTQLAAHSSLNPMSTPFNPNSPAFFPSATHQPVMVQIAHTPAENGNMSVTPGENYQLIIDPQANVKIEIETSDKSMIEQCVTTDVSATDIQLQQQMILGEGSSTPTPISSMVSQQQPTHQSSVTAAVAVAANKSTIIQPTPEDSIAVEQQTDISSPLPCQQQESSPVLAYPCSDTLPSDAPVDSTTDDKTPPLVETQTQSLPPPETGSTDQQKPTTASSSKDQKKNVGNKKSKKDLSKKIETLEAEMIETDTSPSPVSESPPPSLEPETEEEPTVSVTADIPTVEIDDIMSNGVQSSDEPENLTDEKSTEDEQQEELSAEKRTYMKYTYKENQWTPLNPEGKCSYDREFLLQFQKIAEKPKDLPQIDEIILQVPNKPVMSLETNQSFGRVDYFVPSFATKGHRGISMGMLPNRRSQGRDRDREREQREHKPRKIISSASISQDIKLREVDNAWKPSTKKSRDKSQAAEISNDEDGTEDVLKKTRSILNKMTPQKFQSLVKQLTDIRWDTPKCLNGAIDLIFEKAISEPAFSVAYAHMCAILIEKKGNEVKLALISKCRLEFQKDKLDTKNALAEKADAENEIDPVLAEEMRQSRVRSLGNVRFIGELFKLNLLTEKTMHDCILKLLIDKREESLECLCRLMTTIGKNLDKTVAKNRIDQYFTQMEKLIKASKTSSRIRFMLQDLFELRKHGWNPRREDNNPKTIDEIHKEVQEEEEHTQMMLHQQSRQQRGGDRRRGGIQSSNRSSGSSDRPGQNQSQAGTDGDWNTVPTSSRRGARVDPSLMKMSKPPVDEELKLGPGCGRTSLGSSWARGSSGGGAGGKSSTNGSESNKFALLAKVPESDSRRGYSGNSSSSSRGRSSQGQSGVSLGRRVSADDGRRYPRDNTATERQKTLQESRRLKDPIPAEERVLPVSRDRTPEKETAEPVKPNQKQISIEDMEKKTRAILEEFLHLLDFKEATQCVAELHSPTMMYIFVQSCFDDTLERTATARQNTSLFLHHLIKQNIIPIEAYLKGIELVLEFACDMEIDIPHIWAYLAQLISPVVQDDLVSLRQLFTASDSLVALNKCGELFSEILHHSARNVGPLRIGDMWRHDELSWSMFFPPNKPQSEVNEFIATKNLAFTISREEARPNQPLPNREVQTHLEKMLDHEDDNEKIFQWIEANVGSESTNSSVFIRSLVSAVCESIIIGDEPNYRCDEHKLFERIVLLRKYIAGDDKRALQALFAIQALWVKLKNPRNLIKTFFEKLWDKEVIPEESIYTWADDDTEPEGKGAALKSVTAFITWLREAQEESEGDS